MQTRTIENGYVVWHFTAEDGDILEEWGACDEYSDTDVTEAKIYLPMTSVLEAYQAITTYPNLLSATLLAEESFGEDDYIRLDVSKVEFYGNSRSKRIAAVYRAYEKYNGFEFHLDLNFDDELIEELTGVNRPEYFGDSLS